MSADAHSTIADTGTGHSWDTFLTWQKSFLDNLQSLTGPSSVAVLIDDLDMMELLSSDAVATRAVMRRFLALLR